MSDIINIVVHPGYCIGCDGYDQEVYYNQLDKGDSNLFLHPTVDEVGRAVVIKQNIKQVLKEACQNRSIPEVEDLIKLEDCDSINFPYAGYVFRQFMFYKFKSIKKKHKRTKKSYSKILKSLILNNEKFAKQYLFMESNTRPIITGNKINGIFAGEVVQLRASSNFSAHNEPLQIIVYAKNTVNNQDEKIIHTTIVLDNNAKPNINGFTHTLNNNLTVDVGTSFYMDGVIDPNGGPITYDILPYPGLVFSKTTNIASGESVIVTPNLNFPTINKQIVIAVVAKNSVNKTASIELVTMVVKIGEMVYDRPGEHLFIPPTGVDTVNLIMAASNLEITEFGNYLRNDLVLGNTTYLAELLDPLNNAKCCLLDDDHLVVVDGQVYTSLGEPVVRNPKVRMLNIPDAIWVEYPDLTGTISDIKCFGTKIYCMKLYTKLIYVLDTAAETPTWDTLPETLELIDMSDNWLIDKVGNLYQNKVSTNPVIKTIMFDGEWSVLVETDVGIDLGSRSFSVLNYQNKIKMVVNNSSEIGIGWELDLDDPVKWMPVPGLENVFNLGGVESLVINKMNVMVMITREAKLARFHRSGLSTEVFADLNHVFSPESLNSGMVIDSKGDIIIVGGLRANDKKPLTEIRKIKIPRDVIGYDVRVVGPEGFVITGEYPFDPGLYGLASNLGAYKKNVTISNPTDGVRIRIGNNGAIRVIYGRPNFPA